MHHGQAGGPPPPGMAQHQQHFTPAMQQIAGINEAVWMQIGMATLLHLPVSAVTNNTLGSFAELLNNLDEAITAYEHALRANPRSIPAMNAISCILRTQEQFHKAVEYLQSILKLEVNNGEVWGSLGKWFAHFFRIHSLTFKAIAI